MAIGGRPFYDIAKFMVIDVISYPQGLETFLEHAGIKKGESEWGLLRTYVILELIGMINFFKSIEDMEKEEMARSLLYEVVEGKGKFSELLEELRG